MTKKEKVFYGRILHYSKKIMAINYLGGQCKKCGEKNILKLTFHHRENDKKDFEIGHYLDRHWSRIEPELDKCDLLCCNCHYEIHFPDNRDTWRGNKSKKYFLDFLGIIGCEICGYDKCLSSLDFHHINTNDKEFKLSNLLADNKSLLELKTIIEIEINKCQVVCKNCHKLIHNEEFFELNKHLIYEKVNNFRKISVKTDRNLVKELYDNGMKQIDISKKLKVSKGTISTIIKELNAGVVER